MCSRKPKLTTSAASTWAKPVDYYYPSSKAATLGRKAMHKFRLNWR